MNILIKAGKAVNNISFRQIGGAIIILKLGMIAYFVGLLVIEFNNGTLVLDRTFFLFMSAGFVAQVIDGALGMAYGVSCTTLLLNFGLPPKMASASVHTAEIFTTGVSGLSHLKFKNIDKRLFVRIVFTGILGAVTGAYLLSDFLDGKMVKPYVAAYLLILGLYILYKGILHRETKKKEIKRTGLLALAGGLLDAIGGGGWGPIVTSNLINQGQDPRQAIGTVNTAEFFVTYFATAVFIFYLGVDHWQILLGLIAGGILAAPLGAYLASKMKKRVLSILVGTLIVLTSGYTILNVIL
ncbi:MAG TPA: sulfite exporter TauE/SafE family protein [Anseongella sp.]